MTVKQTNYLRAGKRIIPVGKADEKPEDCKSINEAKRRSRALQAQGYIVRKA